jgi:type III secretion system TyeA family effector delivery regulator
MAVFEYKNPADSYRCVLDQMHRFDGKAQTPGTAAKDGPELERSLSASLDFLSNALAADLAASRPSSDPARLRDVVDGLQQVRLLANAHASCRTLMQKFHESTRESVPIAPYRLMSGMLEAVRNERVSESEFTRMAADFNVPPLEPSINFLTQFRDIVSKLPPRTYDKPEAREKVLDAMQRAIDHLIDEEEVALG